MSDMTTPPPEDAEPTSAEVPPAAGAAAPVPAPPPPAPPAPSSGGGWGPPGKIRSWGVVAILSIITCFIYYYVWNYKVFEENKQHSGDGVGGVVGVILAIFIGVVNIFLLPTEIKNIYEKAGQQSPVRWTVGLWNLIPLVGWLIWLYKVQTAINERWEEMGAVRA